MSSDGFVCDPFFIKLMGAAPSVTVVFKNVVGHDDIVVFSK